MLIVHLLVAQNQVDSEQNQIFIVCLGASLRKFYALILFYLFLSLHIAFFVFLSSLSITSVSFMSGV